MTDITSVTNEPTTAQAATRVEVVHDFRMGRRPLLSVSSAHEGLMAPSRSAVTAIKLAHAR